jgi:Phage integrase, N-terminal SAM-like domain
MTAEGSVYQRKDGRWVAQYRDAKDKARYIYRKTKGEAKKALREALRERDGGYVPADKLKVGLYLEEWMQERKKTVSGRTWRVQESMLRNRVKPHVGDVRLSKLSPADVRGMLPLPTLSRPHSIHIRTYTRHPEASHEGCCTLQVHQDQSTRRR